VLRGEARGARAYYYPYRRTIDLLIKEEVEQRADSLLAERSSKERL
jgi:hypothetical protein